MLDSGRSRLQQFSVIPATCLRGIWGTNDGRAMGLHHRCCPGDIYQLSQAAQSKNLSLQLHQTLTEVAVDSPIGKAGNQVIPHSLLRLMDAHGQTVEILTLRELRGISYPRPAPDTTDGPPPILCDRLWLLPLGQLDPNTEYELIQSAPDLADDRFMDAACSSLTAQTRIAMADGSEKAAGELEIGDMVLTRDSGPQPLRWLFRRTMRAAGRFAPLTLHAKDFGLNHDLTVSPDQALYLPADTAPNHPQGRISATALRGHPGVSRDVGGHVDYVRLVFDHHEVVFAEGMAVDSLCHDPRDSSALPAGTVQDIFGQRPNNERLAGDARHLPQRQER